MSDEKQFLTYNQQMRKLRNDKGIVCTGSFHKNILIRAGYFNIINGYKNPFISGQDTNGKHSVLRLISFRLLNNLMKNYVHFCCVISPRLKKKRELWLVTNLMLVTTMEASLGTVQMHILQINHYRKKCPLFQRHTMS